MIDLTRTPNDWKIKSIGKITKTSAGATPSTSVKEFWGGEIKWMSSGDLNLKKVFDVKGRITKLGLNSSSTKLLPLKCILIGLAGQGKTRGTVAMNMIELCTNQSVAAIFPSEQFIEEYLYHNLDYRYDELRQLSTGDGGRGGLNLSVINSIKISLPPLPEQKAIASLLSKWDEAISKNQALIEQKEERKKWLMQNLLTGKKKLIGFSRRWIDCVVSELFQIVDRYVEWDENEQYNLVSIRRRNGGLFFREPLYGDKIAVKKLKEIKTDDFLISKRQVSHGAWAIVTKDFEKGKVSDEYDCLSIQDESTLLPQFWKWYCQLPVLTHYAYVDSNGVHIEKSIFDYNQFKRRNMSIPSDLEEQTAIAKVLQASDKEIQLLKTKADKLKEQKKGLMQLLLTGKKRLKID